MIDFWIHFVMLLTKGLIVGMLLTKGLLVEMLLTKELIC